MLAGREQLLRILLRITSSVLTVTLPAHREKSLGDRLAEHLLKVSYSSHSEFHSGELPGICRGADCITVLNRLVGLAG